MKCLDYLHRRRNKLSSEYDHCREKIDRKRAAAKMLLSMILNMEVIRLL